MPRFYHLRSSADAARLVAVKMISRALASLENCTPGPGDPGSIVVVETPSKEWTQVVVHAWTDLMTPPNKDTTPGQVSPYLHVVMGTEPATPRTADSEEVSEAVASGHPVAGISHDPEKCLPEDLVLGADHVLLLGPPTPADVSAAACQLTGSCPERDLNAIQATALTPRILRLASRPGQSADEYLQRVEALLEAFRTRAASIAGKQPRDAPTLDRLHGMDEAVEWGRSLVEDLRAYQAGELPWSRVGGQGCLLSGPPGCGKTLFARALAASCDRPLVSGSYGEWLGRGDGHQGTLLRAMRDTFAAAIASRPAILFIDEVDAFPNRATVRHRYATWDIQVVNALLGLMDGAQSREGVVVLAACNHPELLDPALVRSGRLDRHIHIGLPPPPALESILREHLGEDLERVNLSGVALMAAGSTGADCERYVRGARRRARAALRPMVLGDLVQEIGTADPLTQEERRRIALHEAGHAVVASEFFPGAVKALVLRSRSKNIGGVFGAPSGVYYLANDVHQRLMFMLAGRAAEQVFLGSPSSGAGGDPGSDLANATRLAATAEAALGLGQELVWKGMPRESTLALMLAKDPSLAARIRSALADAYDAALILVRRRSDAVEAVADALLERSAINGDELAEIVARHPAHSVARSSA